ncbi:TRAF family member-associated NF-kappa-B activator [Denticeps clupeoides]|uniref:Tbk1/Ikki binding domain-containing protein n=1 Tax=Denticeps clupeoides TaxID=299321 RepID=A0AAY4BZS0_9TELE|nr:uncharacterized protein LOC114796913 [Denticeps clupeoides]
MDKNMADQLNKAFDAYRAASIERDSVKKELKQQSEYYESYVQKLKRQIEDQSRQISKLKAQLSSAAGVPGETAPREEEAELLSSCDGHHDNPSSGSRRTDHFLMDDPQYAVVLPHAVSGADVSKAEDVGDAFREVLGKFHLIQTLAGRQKDCLRRIFKGTYPAHEQQFSMPIQCTDSLAERAEVSFPSGSRQDTDEPQASSSLASRGASPDVDSMITKWSVKYPPSTDSTYGFLNSDPEKNIEQHRNVLATVAEEPGSYPASSHHSSSMAPGSGDAVRGPQQALWSPTLSHPPPASPLAACAEPHQQDCAFCNASIPKEHIFSHLNSHFQNGSNN